MKRHNDQPLKDVLREMVEAYRLKPKLHQTKVRSMWEDLMGPSISRYTRDLYLRRKKLYVNLNSAPLRQELSLGKEKIRKIFNEALGEDYIEEVIIR